MSTLRRRISFALTAVVVLFVSVQGYLAYTSLEQQEDDLVDDIVMSETKRLMTRIANGDADLDPASQPWRLAPNLMAWLVTSDDVMDAIGVPERLRRLPDGVHMAHESDHVIHSVHVSTPSGRLIVRYDATDNEAFVYRFGAYLVVTGLAFIALGALLSSWIAWLVVAPIRRLAEQLSQWSPGSGSRGVGHSDEETLLLQAFDQVQARLDATVAHEREFAANVRHEIRTPLAALRTDAEMLAMTEALSAAGQTRLSRMITAVDTAAESVEAAHALSTASPSRPEPIDLADSVARAWLSLKHLNPEDRLQLRVQLASDDRPMLDRQALMTILRNLLRNAIEHAAPGTCEVSRTGSGLIVRDDGPGIAPDALPRIFDRYFIGRLSDVQSAPQDPRDAGRGLGLAIARQTALQQGWSLTAQSSPGQGTTFRLDFWT